MNMKLLTFRNFQYCITQKFGESTGSAFRGNNFYFLYTFIIVTP